MQDGRKRSWDDAASGHGMEDVWHEMAERASLRELAYKSLRTEAGRIGGRKHIGVEDMSKDCQLKIKTKEGLWIGITWDWRMSRGTGTLAEAVRDRFKFNWLGE